MAARRTGSVDLVRARQPSLAAPCDHAPGTNWAQLHSGRDRGDVATWVTGNCGQANVTARTQPRRPGRKDRLAPPPLFAPLGRAGPRSDSWPMTTGPAVAGGGRE